MLRKSRTTIPVNQKIKRTLLYLDKIHFQNIENKFA